MKIKEIKVKSIIVKSGLPESDYVINPYIGCSHGCIYCYARFMKRFTGHLEKWGSFVDVKINAPDLVPENTDKYRGKSIIIGTVTDPYHPLEMRYKLTRRILQKLIPLEPCLDILTKSDLVVRDIDLIKQFKEHIISISISTLDNRLGKELEPGALPVERKISALEKLHQEGIITALFISPILPGITDWRKIVNKTKPFVKEYWFENLNLYPTIRANIYRFLKKVNPELIEKYKEIYSGKSDYWRKEEIAIRKFCKENKIIGKIYFHHKRKD